MSGKKKLSSLKFPISISVIKYFYIHLNIDLLFPAFFILGAGTGIATLVFICELLVGGITRLKNDISQVKVILII